MKILIALSLLATSMIVSSEEEKQTGKCFRFIALGDRLKNVQELPHPGPDSLTQLPPFSVLVSRSKKSSEEVPILLNQISPSVGFVDGTEVLKLWAKRDLEKGPWLEVKPKGFDQSLGIIYRDEGCKNGYREKPKVLVVDDSAESFSAGKIRLVNTTDQIVWVRLGEKRPFALPPGKSGQAVVEDGKGSLTVGYLGEDGTAKMIWKNMIVIKKGERMQGFVFGGLEGVTGKVRFQASKERIENL